MSKKEKKKANNAKYKKVTVGNCAYFTKRINLNKNNWHKCPHRCILQAGSILFPKWYTIQEKKYQ